MLPISIDTSEDHVNVEFAFSISVLPSCLRAKVQAQLSSPPMGLFPAKFPLLILVGYYFLLLI